MIAQTAYRRVIVLLLLLLLLRVAPVSSEVLSDAVVGRASGALNSTGILGAKDDWIDELRLSRSRASRARVLDPPPVDVDDWRGELPFSMWDGMADGFGAGGEPEPIMRRWCLKHLCGIEQ